MNASLFDRAVTEDLDIKVLNLLVFQGDKKTLFVPSMRFLGVMAIIDSAAKNVQFSKFLNTNLVFYYES